MARKATSPKQSPVETIAQGSGTTVAEGKRNVRFQADGKTVAIGWPRGNGALVVKVEKGVKLAAEFKKHAEVTKDGMVRMKVTRDEVELGDLDLAIALVQAAVAARQS